MPKRMSLPQIRAYDKRRAGRHEAGHVAYGQAKGLPVSACLWKNPDSPKTFAECQQKKCWLGRAFFCPNDFAHLSKLEKAAFALAGAIAQEEADSAELVMDCWKDFNFSETDLCYVPVDWEENLASEKFVLSAVNDAIAVL